MAFHRGACCPARRCAGDRRGTVRRIYRISPVVGAVPRTVVRRGCARRMVDFRDGGLRRRLHVGSRVIACCPLRVRAPMRRKCVNGPLPQSETGLTKSQGGGLVTQRPDPMEWRKHRDHPERKGYRAGALARAYARPVAENDHDALRQTNRAAAHAYRLPDHSVDDRWRAASRGSSDARANYDELRAAVEQLPAPPDARKQPGSSGSRLPPRSERRPVREGKKRKSPRMSLRCGPSRDMVRLAVQPQKGRFSITRSRDASPARAAPERLVVV